jgi:two-component system, NtrC family, nitrogen regulation sensor histidine kinase GlnL
MNRLVASAAPAAHQARADAPSILAALPFAVLVVGADDRLQFANSAAEQLFGLSAQQLAGLSLEQIFAADSPVVALARQARRRGNTVTAHDMTVGLARHDPVRLSVEAVPMGEADGAATQVVLAMRELSLARKFEDQLVHRGAARSVAALSGMLAHEVKNPLSGIRGAAQLLEQTVSDDDRALTRLICAETDRICALVDRMAVFSDGPAIARGPVNIHEVLERVRAIAQAGFARERRFVERYDPSLPPVYGDRDQLIQIFLNLVKNAAEATAPDAGVADGEIVLHTAFRHGVHLAVPGGVDRVQIPLVVTIADNGPGVADDIRPCLFDAFVTGRSTGSGLGLALVAKLVGDHGGVVEFDSTPGRTAFRVMLPVTDWPDPGAAEQGG